jgi:ABC-type transport system involved in multi-copper enzyme maturation permease subunit
VSGAAIVAGYALREAARRRALVVVLALTAAFLVLYALGVDRAFRETAGFEGTASEVGVDVHTVAGAFMFGLSMFATLFLGVILAVFLTLGAVRGDAERGLLQALVVRPIGRPALLLGRYAGAVAAAAVYVWLVYGVAVGITGAIGGWWPDRPLTAALELAGAVGIVTALSLLGSVLLSATANGIAVLMVFGAGLTAGLLGQVGEAIDSPTLVDVGRYASWALPFEALYQDALAAISADSGGVTRLAIDLGPFGGAHAAGPGLWAWAAAYTALVGAAALWAFSRRDL